MSDMWRVDVAGYPVSVRGVSARLYLERVNQQLARMKLALHKIAKLDVGQGGEGQIARDTLRAIRE